MSRADPSEVLTEVLTLDSFEGPVRETAERPQSRGWAPVVAAFLTTTIACSTSAIRNPCDPVDAVLADSAFVVVASPTGGAAMRSPIAVSGCSRTFESNVVWRLHARDGRTLASGHTSGGGVAGAANFSFSAAFALDEPELGHLEVFEPDVSEGEGFPGGRTVIPLVLLPGPPG